MMVRSGSTFLFCRFQCSSGQIRVSFGTVTSWKSSALFQISINFVYLWFTDVSFRWVLMYTLLDMVWLFQTTRVWFSLTNISVVSFVPYTFEYGGTEEHKTFTWTIISRRSCRRAGTRLYRRGIDLSGNVANFVETEQIVEYEGAKSSFVQVNCSAGMKKEKECESHFS